MCIRRRPWTRLSPPTCTAASPTSPSRRAQTVLADASTAHPERFPAGRPHQPARPVEVRINPPTTLLPLSESSNPRPLPLADAGAFA